VRSLVYDARKGRVTGVRMIDAKTKAERVYTGRLVFLCASALESVRHSSFNSGLANYSLLPQAPLMENIYDIGRAGLREARAFER